MAQYCRAAGLLINLNLYSLETGAARDLAHLANTTGSPGQVYPAVIEAFNHGDNSVREGVTKGYIGTTSITFAIRPTASTK